MQRKGLKSSGLESVPLVDSPPMVHHDESNDFPPFVDFVNHPVVSHSPFETDLLRKYQLRAASRVRENIFKRFQNARFDLLVQLGKKLQE